MKTASSPTAFLAHARALVPRRVADVAPGLATLLHYPRSFLRFDLTAGVTVGAVAVPSSLAMAELAGLPVVYGLYGTFLPLAMYGLLGTSRQHVIGPDSTLAALTAVTVAPLATAGGEVDPARYVLLASVLALAMGAILFLAGLLRLGFFADFFGKPVLLGYINGVALIVIASQLGKLLGIDVDARDFFAIIAEIVPKLGDANGPDRDSERGVAGGCARREALPSWRTGVTRGARGRARHRGCRRSRSSRDRGHRGGERRPAASRVAARRSTGLHRSAASGGSIRARRLRRHDRDRAHVREQARLHGRPEPRTERARRREPHRRIEQRVSGFLLQLTLCCQRLQRREIAGCGRGRRCGGRDSFCSSRCL